MKTTKSGSNGLLTYQLSEPLNGTRTAKIDINCDTANLTIDRLTGGEQVLASGSLQYFEKKGQPTRNMDSKSGRAILTLSGAQPGRPMFRFPWSACNGALDWQIQLNPLVPLDITARSGGGNIKLHLAGMSIASLTADNGGGNIEVVLPDIASDLNVDVKTGAGTVTVYLPDGIEGRVYAASGLGKVVVDPRFSKIDDKTYQSANYDGAAHKVEIKAQSGAGSVIVTTHR